MRSLQDVQIAIYELYHKYGKDEGKFSEGLISVYYPTIFDVDKIEDFLYPERICVYSYLYGPNRNHTFIKSTKDYKKDSNTWYCKDVFTTAYNVIKGMGKGIY